MNENIKELKRDLETRLADVEEELRTGIEAVEKHEKTVSFFGSSRYTEDNKYYQIARSIAGRLAQEGYTIITGGGPGIMEAANRGAYEQQCGASCSLGLNIELPKEQEANKYADEKTEFHYLFTRKVVLTYSAEAVLFFPGGYGTLDEFFEILTLLQTEKISPLPIIGVGSEFWNQVRELITDTLQDMFHTVSKGEEKFFFISDDEDEIIEQIKKSPIRTE